MKKRYFLIIVLFIFLFYLKGASSTCYDSGGIYTPNAYCYDNYGIHYNYCSGSYIYDYHCDYYPYVHCGVTGYSCGSSYVCSTNYCKYSPYNPPTPSCVCYYNGIDHHCGPDSCGKTNGCGKCYYPEYCGSDYQCHSPCTSHYTYKCYSNDVYWYNSCNQRESKKQECYSAGCSGNKCCTSHYTSKCYNNDVYWYSSCNHRQDKKQECGSLGCSNNQCCTSHYTSKCYDNDVYWYSSCNQRQDKKQECGTLGCSNNKCNTCTSHYTSKCYDDDVYWYDSCNKKEDKKQECGTAGCSNNQCCTSHYTSKCYDDDVYWYSSCNNLQDKKQECGSSGCSNNKCKTQDCYDHCISLGYNQGECLTQNQNNQCGGSINCYYNFFKDTSQHFCADNGETGNCWCYDSEPCNDCGNTKECTQTGCCTKNEQHCSQDSDCCSNHCENGYCCDSGICCNNNNDCLLDEYCNEQNNCEQCPQGSCGAKKGSKKCGPNQYGRFDNENHCSLICENEIDSRDACEKCNSKYFIPPVFSPSVLNQINIEIDQNKLSSDVKTKNGCCLKSTDCVYNGICVSIGTRLDVDLDLKEEICG